MRRAWRRIRNRFRPNSHSQDQYQVTENDISERDLYLLLRLYESDILRPRSKSAPSPLPPPLKDDTNAKNKSLFQEKLPKARPDCDLEMEMVKELACPVCKNTFNDPVMSPCLHSVCSNCAEKFLSRRNKFPCPVCKREITRDKLKRNYPLKGIVESFNRRAELKKCHTGLENKKKSIGTKEQIDKAICEIEMKEEHKLNVASCIPKTPKCDICDTPPSLFCVQCTLRFCDSCLCYYHPTLGSTMEHSLINIVVEDKRLEEYCLEEG